jgi:hypothetical protein
LLGPECYEASHRPALILLFAKKFFRWRFSVAALGERRIAMSIVRIPPLQQNQRMRWTGQIFWLLAFEDVDSLSLIADSEQAERLWLSTLNHQLPTNFTFFPPSPPKWFPGLAQWEVVSSYSSATAPDSHGISCTDSLFQARKELR